MPIFTRKEKSQHYKDVAKGKKPPKKDFKKHDEKEQQAYARGRMDEYNEQKRDYKYNTSTPEQREEYNKKRAVEQFNYWSERLKKDKNDERAKEKVAYWYNKVGK